MTEEQAMQYVKTASEKALKELEKRKSVHFELTSKKPSVFESKIGGEPYFPKGAEIPCDSDGYQLRFLMQINCSEINGIDNFPQKGMIQFWIAADDCWGMCDENDKGFRVIYYHTITENVIVPQISEFTEEEEEFFPLQGEYGVKFTPVTEDMTKNSVVYNKTFCKYFNELSGENIEDPFELQSVLNLPFKVYDEATTDDSACGHKVGGYSDFCQGDPRDPEDEHDFQILQMESEFGKLEGGFLTEIVWGDSGICHFFINSEKLKNCDFSDILYYCDCC